MTDDRALDDLEDRPQLRPLREFRLLEDVDDAVGEDLLHHHRIGLLQLSGDHLADVRRQRRQLRRSSAHLRRRQPGELGIQQGGGRIERRLVERLVRQLTLQRVAVEPPLADVAVGQHEDQQPRPVGQRNELDVAEPRAARARRRDDRGGSGAAREDRCGQAEPFIARQLHLAELVPDHEPIGRVELRLAHQRFDVQPIPEVGRHPSGTGVRVAEQPERLELRHRASDRRRRDAQSIARHERLGPDGHGGEDVVLDDSAQHRSLAIGQLDGRAAAAGAFARNPFVGHHASWRWVWHSRA